MTIFFGDFVRATGNVPTLVGRKVAQGKQEKPALTLKSLSQREREGENTRRVIGSNPEGY